MQSLRRHLAPTFAPLRWRSLLARAWARIAGGANGECACATAWVEEYEPRVLYSADLASHALLAADGPQVVEQRVIDAAGEFTAVAAVASSARELVIVDAAVDLRNIELNQILTNNPSIELIALRGSRSGAQVVQIGGPTVRRAEEAMSA